MPDSHSTRPELIPFPREEFQARLDRVRARAAGKFDCLLVTEPANICYLTGYDAWSFYLPQALIVPVSSESPYMVLRESDRAAALWTTYLHEDDIIPYPEALVSGAGHPMRFIAETIKDRTLTVGRVGVEFDSSCFTISSFKALKDSLADATISDTELCVEWVRTFKTDAEVDAIRTAAQISDKAMEAAHAAIIPGAREAEVAAAVYQALITGIDGAAGSCPLRPCMMRGEQTNTPHLSWTDGIYQKDEPVVIELGGQRHNYAAGLTRTFFLGNAPKSYVELDATVLEGRQAALEAMRPGSTAEQVEAAWRNVVNPRGVEKSARIGYSIGLSFPSATWVERTLSLAPGDKTELAPNMTLHLMLEVWGDRIGHGLSDSVLVTEGEPDVLSSTAPELRIK